MSELPAAQRRALGIDYGLVVENADASRTALRPGDVIVGVGRESFKSVEDFERLIGEQKQGDTVALLVGEEKRRFTCRWKSAERYLAAGLPEEPPEALDGSITISTRRLSCRPVGVSLEATGNDGP